MKTQDPHFDEATETWQRERIDEIRAWAEAVELPQPCQLEIGANRGRFFMGLAALYPDRSLIAIEIKPKFAQQLQQTLDQAGHGHRAKALGADANLAVPLLFADGHLERAYVLFPDPWWKKRHAKRRLLTPAFLDLLASKLAPGGHLVLKTDVEPYAEYLKEILAEVSDVLRPVKEGDPQWPSDVEAWPMTNREAHITRMELPIWSFILARTEAPVPDRDAATRAPEVRFPKPAHMAADAATRPRARS